MTADEFKMTLDRVKAFYVYVLSVNGIPFYVGKGTRDVRWSCQHRALMHEKNARCMALDAKSKFIRRSWRQGLSVTYELAFMSNHESQCFFHEQVLIAEYGKRSDKGILFNLVDGGQGMTGYKLSATTRARMSATRTGRKLSADWRANIAAGRLLSKKVKIENQRRKIPVLASGKIYDSAVDAGTALGVAGQTIRYRIQTGKSGYAYA